MNPHLNSLCMVHEEIPVSASSYEPLCLAQFHLSGVGGVGGGREDVALVDPRIDRDVISEEETIVLC